MRISDRCYGHAAKECAPTAAETATASIAGTSPLLLPIIARADNSNAGQKFLLLHDAREALISLCATDDFEAHEPGRDQRLHARRPRWRSPFMLWEVVLEQC